MTPRPEDAGFEAGIEIRSRREALGMSQDELATHLGITQGTLSRWETGTRTPRDPTSIIAQLNALQDAHHDLARALTTAATTQDDPVLLTTHTTTESLWQADPTARAQRLPASLHRAATATAAHTLTRAGRTTRITTNQ